MNALYLQSTFISTFMEELARAKFTFSFCHLLCKLGQATWSLWAPIFSSVEEDNNTYYMGKCFMPGTMTYSTNTESQIQSWVKSDFHLQVIYSLASIWRQIYYELSIYDFLFTSSEYYHIILVR